MREHVGEPPLSLTRRRVGRFHRIVNRGPAKCYSLPDTDRQGRGCARGLACGARVVLLECLVFVHACCLTRCVKQNGLREVTFLFRRGSRSPLARSRIGDAVIGHGGFTSGLRVSLWRSRRRTKGRGNGERSRRRGVGAFLREHIGFVMFSAGSTLGKNAEAALRPRPRLRQGDLSPWTLFI